jgi:hypothetical protein
MSDLYDQHDELPVLNLVNDSICALPDTVSLEPGKFFAAARPWLVRERTDALQNPRYVLLRERPQILGNGFLEA